MDIFPIFLAILAICSALIVGVPPGERIGSPAWFHMSPSISSTIPRAFLACVDIPVSLAADGCSPSANVIAKG